MGFSRGAQTGNMAGGGGGRGNLLHQIPGQVPGNNPGGSPGGGGPSYYHPAPGASPWGPGAGYTPRINGGGGYTGAGGGRPPWADTEPQPYGGGGGGASEGGASPPKYPGTRPMPADPNNNPFDPSWAYTGYTPGGVPTYGPSWNQQSPVGDDMAQWPDWLLQGRPGPGQDPRADAQPGNPRYLGPPQTAPTRPWSGGNGGPGYVDKAATQKLIDSGQFNRGVNTGPPPGFSSWDEWRENTKRGTNYLL